MNFDEALKLHDEDKLEGSFKIGNEDYHKAPGISSTFLSDIMEYSVGHAKAWKDKPMEPTKAMAFGSLIHLAILEPELLAQKYHVVPSTDKRKKDVLLIYSKAELEGWTPITQETMDKVLAIRSALLSSNTGKALFGEGIAEQAFFTRDPDTGLLIKCKADFINTKHKILIDIKKTADGRLWNIKKSVQNYGYKLQASFYKDVINMTMGNNYIDSVVWVFIEEESPHGIRFVEVNKNDLQHGFDLYKEALTRLHNALQSGKFPLYEDKIVVIEDGQNE
jgi:exodeoxyribonuclease VIII